MPPRVSFYGKASIPQGRDIDHTIDLPLGGKSFVIDLRNETQGKVLMFELGTGQMIVDLDMEGL